jgi:hypothetical protein
MRPDGAIRQSDPRGRKPASGFFSSDARRVGERASSRLCSAFTRCSFLAAALTSLRLVAASSSRSASFSARFQNFASVAGI